MMSKTQEALKLALEALEDISSHYMSLPKIGCMALAAVEEALTEQETVLPGGGHVPAVPVAVYGYCPECGGAGVMRERRPNGDDKCTNGHKYPSSKALAEQPAQQQKEGFASPGGGYVPAIPRPMPLDWKLVPRKATPEMLKAMDECAQEGYDERLYAGMASSVYMAAWDASPVMGTLPERPAQQQCRTDGRCQYAIDSGAEGMGHCPKGKCIMPAQRQEPVAVTRLEDGYIKIDYLADPFPVGPLYAAPLQSAQPEQEPVAWRWTESNGRHWFDWRTDWTHHDRAKAMGFAIEYAYTSPPASKPWVGLTDVEWQEIDASLNGKRDLARIFTRAIEAKLREKNA